MTDARVYAGAVLVGAAAGLRSFTAPAVVSELARSRALAAEVEGLQFVRRPAIAHTITALAIGEAIADKLPFIPNRTDAVPLIGRAVTGGLSAAAVCSSNRRSPIWGALLGAVSAVGAAYAAYELRRRASKALCLPDAVIAIAEDALAVTSSWAVVSRLGTAHDF